MQAIKTIGLDIAKSIFQVHGVDADGQVVIRRKLKRRHVLAFFEKLPPCLVGMEACATSHHWSRELQALVAGSLAAKSALRSGAIMQSPIRGTSAPSTSDSNSTMNFGTPSMSS